MPERPRSSRFVVARVARDIGAALGLNLDLIEAIALGHDIGHTPFGHAGERFLNDVYHARTSRFFAHNVQSVRVLDVTYGRNLALQTLDGVICHNGEFEQQVFATSDLACFEEFDRGVEECWEKGGPAIACLRPMTLEGCVVRVSDIIAYVGKDRQDAIRAGLCTEKSFDDGLGGAYNAWALGAFVADVVENSLDKPRIEMSEEGFAEMRRAKRFRVVSRSSSRCCTSTSLRLCARATSLPPSSGTISSPSAGTSRRTVAPMTGRRTQTLRWSTSSRP